MGTGLAAVGSLYGLLADDTKRKADNIQSRHDKEHCPCLHHHHHHHHNHSDDNESCSDSSQEIARSIRRRASHDRADGIMEMRRPTDASSVSPTRRWTSNTTSQEPHLEHHENIRRSDTLDTTGTTRVGTSRMNVAKAFERVGEIFGNPAPDRFNDSILQSGPAAEFPTTPGEEYLNRELPKMQDKYNATQLQRQRSRNGSFIGGEGAPGGGQGSEGHYHHRHSTSELYRMDTWAGPSTRASVDGSSSPAPRRATLEPPKPTYHPGGLFGSPSPRVVTTFDSLHTSGLPPDIQEGPQNPLTIVVSTASDQPTS